MAQPNMIIRNARIVDGSSDRAADPVDIRIEDGKFVEVASGLTAGSVSTEIDVSGKYVMPGLIDCHVHIVAATTNLAVNAAMPNSLVAAHAYRLMSDMLMRGFTTVRDLGGADYGFVRAVNEGIVASPRLVICGKALSQTGGHTDYRGPYHNRDVSHYPLQIGSLGRVVDGVAEVQRACREELKSGANFIKLMANGGVSSPTDPIHALGFARDEILAAVEEAEKFHTYVAAHLYTDESIRRALELGVTCVEHGNLMSKETAELLVEKGAVVVPTNIVFDALEREGQKYGMGPEGVEKNRQIREAGLERLEMLQKVGATMGYGSDLIGELQGYQSDEFTLRGRYLPAHEVIRSATLNAAKVLHMEGEIGVIAPGAHADLVVVEGNPLEDLQLLTGQGRHMSLIMQGGQLKKNLLTH